MADLGKEFLNTIKKSDQRKTTPFDAVGTVTRVKDGIAYVHFAGGVDETPVKLTINAQAGDEVQVRVADGRAWLVGNATSPPTDDAQARRAIILGKQANDAAVRATKDAMVAHEAAESASKSAREAKETTDEINAYAETAGKTVTQILSDGETAGTAAQQAKSAADKAVKDLSQVENVVGVINWVAEHGEMISQAGGTFDPAKVYFIVDPNGDYHIGNTHYSVVSEPKAEDIDDYYILNIEESVQNYVMTHLFADEEGLWLIPEENATVQTSSKKVLIAVGGIGHTYPDAGTYIIEKVNGSDVMVAAFTADGTQIGRNGESHLRIDFQSLFLKDKEGDAYFAVQDLRESDGKYLVEETLMTADGTPPDGSTTLYALSFSVASGFVLKVNGTAQMLGSDYTCSGQLVYFTTAPQEGDIVTAEYYSRSPDLKTYVLGVRRSGSFAGAYSVVAGYYCAAGNYAHAEGTYTEATGMGSHAEGSDSKATMPYSHAEGWYTEANGFASHAQNSHTVAEYDYQTAIGEYNNNQEDNAFEIGNGTSGFRSNAFEVDWDGNVTPSGQVKTSFKSSVAMGSYASAQTTIPNFVDEVRYSSGCAGSVEIGTAYTKDGVTISAGWYNFMYMPHRTGGKNGQVDPAATDNVEYGNLLLFGFGTGSGRYDITVDSGAIIKLAKLITSEDMRKSPTISTHTKNVGKIAANTYKDCETNTITPTAAQSGLTPVITGWNVSGTGTSSCQVMGDYLSGNATSGYVGHVKVKNDSNAQIGDVTIEVRVLWV